MIPLGLFGTFGFGEIVAILIRSGLRGSDRGEDEPRREDREDKTRG
jgi:hypothetical protein